MTDPFTTPSQSRVNYKNQTSSVTFAELCGLIVGGVVPDSNDGYVGRCPGHADSHASLRLAYNAESRKVLLRCRAGCDSNTVVTALGLTVHALFNVEPGNLNVASVGDDTAPVPQSSLDAIAAYVTAAAAALAENTPAAMEARAYAAHRFNLSSETAADLRIGLDDMSLPHPGLGLSRPRYRDVPRLVVPFAKFDGSVHYAQARDLTGSSDVRWSGPVNPEGCTWGVYGVFRGGVSFHEIIVTEGPGDALAAAAAGFDAVAIRGAALASSESLADEIADGVRDRPVIVAGDADQSGRKFTLAVVTALEARGCTVSALELPPGVNDLSDWAAAAKRAFAGDLMRGVNDATAVNARQETVDDVLHELTHLFSDVQNARMLKDALEDAGTPVRHLKELGWVIYSPTTGVWAPDSAEHIRNRAQNLLPRIQRTILDRLNALAATVAQFSSPQEQTMAKEAIAGAKAKLRDPETAQYVMSSRAIDAMLRELRACDVYAVFDDFDTHPDVLAVGNGVVNLQTGELRPFSDETRDLMLMNRVPTAYRPEARCPRWERFIDEVFEPHAGHGMSEFLRRLVGYGITGHTTEQIIAVLQGKGANGKGVLIETLSGILGGITKTTPFSTFEAKDSGGIPNDIAALKGARLVMASEGDQGKHFAEALIKRLTGGDTITARFMRREFFSFTPAFLILLATNHRPVIRGQDDGIWRRIRLIPFDRKFAGADIDRYLTAKLIGRTVPASAHRPDDDLGDGAEGILAWAIAGAVEWYRGGLQVPTIITAATEQYKNTEDQLGEFMRATLSVDAHAYMKAADAWDAYRKWGEEENLPAREMWTRNTFYGALEERSATRDSSGRMLMLKGIRLRRPSDG